MWLGALVLKRPWLYAISGKAARLALRILPRGLVYNRLNPWGKQRELPAAPQQSFRQLFKNRHAK
jgi:L-lactate dehydrogenase complex protein LldF